MSASAWPIEEVWLRPAVTLLLAAALPPLLSRFAKGFFDAEPARASALALPRALVPALGFALGATALGPQLVASRHSVLGHGFGLLCAAAALGADAVAARRMGLERPARPAELAALLGAALALDAGVWLASGAPRIAVTAGTLFALGIVAHARQPGRRHRVGWLVGATLGIALAAAAALPALLTPITEEEATGASQSAARWRLRVDPWDAEAMLASAWAASRRDDLRHARAQLEEARRMGLAPAPGLELEAELAAAEGDCAAARALFDRALTARAEEAFEQDALAEPLQLGGYHLPPTMVTECGGLDLLELEPPR